MVQKLQNGEYLKRYDYMTAEQRKAYEERVGEWMQSGVRALMAKAQEFNARMQNIETVSLTWNDAECQAFEEGARLLSALVGLTDTWLPDMLYVKSAKRAILTMYEAINAVIAQKHNDTMDASKEETAAGTGKATQSVDGQPIAKSYTVKADGAVSVSVTPETSSSVTSQQTDVTKYPDPGVTMVNGQSSMVNGLVPARPKHVDQYVHLLPQKTQERAAQLKDLYRELDETRRKMALLMDDKTAKDDDRAAWAKKATSIDNKIRKILDELDAEWAKLVKQGRVVVDDLGNARVINQNDNGEMINDNDGGASAGSGTAEEKPELSSEEKAKRRDLRKWLVDTRRGNGDTREEHVKKWQENFKAFLALEGDTAFEDEKIKAAAEHYGIELAALRSNE